MKITNDMLDVLVENGIDKNVAVASIRNFAKYFGGQIYYFPIKKNSERAEFLFNLFKKETSDNTAEKITTIIIEVFGGTAEYVPKEFQAFRMAIAKEIYSLYENDDKNKMNDICHKYNISYAMVYKLIREYKKYLKSKKNKDIKKNTNPESVDSQKTLF